MNQNIKSTLYRFTTMRAPERIEKKTKDSYFVQSDSINHDFKNLSFTDTAFLSKIANYSPVYKSLQSLESTFQSFYNFAIWLTKNRTKVTKNDTNTEFLKVTKFNKGLDNTVLLNLWNDLHFYSYKQTNPEVRDAIISLLVSDFFYREIIADATNFSNEEIQKVASARVILDLNSIELESADQGDLSRLNRMELKRSATYSNSKQNAKLIDKVLNEIELAEEAYNRKTKKAKSAYDASYEKDLAIAYSKATLIERVITDTVQGQLM